MYQYSLEWFIDIFLLAIKTAEKPERNLQRRLTATCQEISIELDVGCWTPKILLFLPGKTQLPKDEIIMSSPRQMMILIARWYPTRRG